MSSDDISLPTQQFDDGTETNVHVIAEKICRHPPQAPQTIQLFSDPEGLPDDIDYDTYEYEILCVFTVTCIRTLYGDGALLTQDQLPLINQYLNSIGYSLTTRYEDSETQTKMIMSFSPYIPTNNRNPLSHLQNYMSSNTCHDESENVESETDEME
jgi:hypothetical protein